MAGLTKEQKAERAQQEALFAKAVELSGLKAEEFKALSAEEQDAFTVKAKEFLHALELAIQDSSEDEVDNSHLVKVTKDGETLEVHPACLADHKRIGWKEL
ncbi:hypothetical protein [Pseudomonas sp. URMO17WK12:I12]|uniref:hypothetical protein n=1 Tax=Pseudomonas sp. URMO17WK12:I12 TaxID=1259797 RepID=UPI00048510AC|nr:hypothetical protein [Pseudomonas sp. URMO17WK12:I12]